MIVDIFFRKRDSSTLFLMPETPMHFLSKFPFPIIALNLICLLFATLVPSVCAETRIWTDITGQYEIEADYVRKANGKVYLRKSDGQLIAIEYKMLSAADKQYLETLDSEGSSTAKEETPPETDDAEKSDIVEKIEKIGRTRPNWWDEVELNYPETLDLSWPLAPPRGGWNNRVNMGQYLWDIINPNQNRWREGIRLMHHLLKLHQDDPEKLKRDMRRLGNMYYQFEQDHARAAFWLQKAGVEQHPFSTLLARCYWKLGDAETARAIIDRNPIYYPTIKLIADMGDTDRALKIAESAASQGQRPDMAYLYAGDACRIAGRFDQAIEQYQKILDLPARRHPRSGRDIYQRNKQRARENIATIRVFEKLDLQTIAEGTYHAHSPAYAGELHVAVTVEDGRIEDVTVTKHKEKQYYSSIIDTPRQIVEKQGVKGVDAVSGATITSEAIVNAVAKALGEQMPAN
jgi:uncharacterized protein with FMN-binding domain